MTWTKLDDRWDDSEKLAAAAEVLAQHGDSAYAMWSRAVTFCNRKLSDGRISGAKLRELTKHKRPRTVVDALVSVGAIEDVGDDLYQIHDFLDWNDSREVVEQRRAGKREAASKGGKTTAERRASGAPAEHQEASTRAAPCLTGSAPSGVPLEQSSPSPSPSASTKHREDGVTLELIPSEPGPAADVRAVWDAYADAARQAGRKPPKVTSERSARVRARIAELGVETVIAAVRGVWLHPWAKPGGTCGSPAGAVSPEDVMRNVANVEKYAATWEESQRGKVPRTTVQRESDRDIAADIVREKRERLAAAMAQIAPVVEREGPAVASSSDLGAA